MTRPLEQAIGEMGGNLPDRMEESLRDMLDRASVGIAVAGR